MNTKWITAAAVAISSTLVAGGAAADEKDQGTYSESEHALAPADHSVELTVGTGYEQAFGKMVKGQPTFTDVGTAGGAVEAGVGYRLIPQLTLGVYGSGGMFGRGNSSSIDSSTNLYTASAGAKADWHFLAAKSQLDPWISLGSGWRGYWLNTTQGTTSIHGWEIAKLEVGLDVRVNRSVAIGPVIGADVSTFLTQATPTSDGFANISNPQASTFLFAGVQGRFDIPSESRKQVASR
jgi:hypothetical protein